MTHSSAVPEVEVVLVSTALSLDTSLKRWVEEDTCRDSGNTTVIGSAVRICRGTVPSEVPKCTNECTGNTTAVVLKS